MPLPSKPVGIFLHQVTGPTHRDLFELVAAVLPSSTHISAMGTACPCPFLHTFDLITRDRTRSFRHAPRWNPQYYAVKRSETAGQIVFSVGALIRSKPPHQPGTNCEAKWPASTGLIPTDLGYSCLVLVTSLSSSEIERLGSCILSSSHFPPTVLDHVTRLVCVAMSVGLD